MKKIKCKVAKLLVTFLFSTSLLSGGTPSQAKIKVLYSSLDPHSIAEHLAFYQLFSKTPEGKEALRHSWKLLNGRKITLQSPEQLPYQSLGIERMIDLIIKPPHETFEPFKTEELHLLESIGAQLANRQLKGYHATSEQDVLALQPEEIDIARGVFLTQLGNSPDAFNKIRTYEAILDLMALEIEARLPDDSTDEQKIKAINRFVFYDMEFRFPPHSEYAKDIDLYTFLPSVLDSHRGVCLGVSILYLALAQRLNLPLEIITPPGHIYVRYHQGDQIINIETTARGVDAPSELYLSLGTRKPQIRTLKETIGAAHVNHASIYWRQKEYQKALETYQKAEPYLEGDKQLKELMGYTYLFLGQDEKGRELLEGVRDYVPDFAITKETMAEDYLNGRTDGESIKAIFEFVDETRESLLLKKESIEKCLSKYPQFRAALLHLAILWLQLHRGKEALEVLEQYHALYPEDPTAEYYLAALYTERLNYHKAWEHLANAERIVKTKDHSPKALKELRRELASLSPE